MSCDWGESLRVSVFGESHAEAVGVTLEGLPANEAVDLDELARFLRRRAPGRGALVSARREPDLPQITDGLRDGKCASRTATSAPRTTTRCATYPGPVTPTIPPCSNTDPRPCAAEAVFPAG